MQAVLYGLVGFAVGFMQAYTPATAGSVWLISLAVGAIGCIGGAN